MTNLKQWVKDNYDLDKLTDIVQHGCASGCVPSLIYYTDTVAFHDKFADEIWDLLTEQAEDQGVTELELIASFNGQKDVSSMTQLKNLLAWFAVEAVAYELINEIEGE